MTAHHLPLVESTLHGCFDASLAPVLTIDPGDSVTLQTIDASWCDVARNLSEATPIDLDRPSDAGHALCGPIAIRGAEPGDALLVDIVELVSASWGFTAAGPRPANPWFDLGVTEHTLIAWSIDRAAGVARDRNELGLEVPIRPFMGVMGTAPAEPGRHTTTPPRRVGGNIDCRELVAGSTLLLPVEVPGALFSVGDGHAAQGDGEVGQTAIECGMDRVELRFRLVSGASLPGPQAATPAGYITLGIGDTLDEAAAGALGPMLSLLQDILGLSRGQVMALASVAVDLRVTQVVNGGRLGVHAVLPPSAPGCAEAMRRVR